MTDFLLRARGRSAPRDRSTRAAADTAGRWAAALCASGLLALGAGAVRAVAASPATTTTTTTTSTSPASTVTTGTSTTVTTPATTTTSSTVPAVTTAAPTVSNTVTSSVATSSVASCPAAKAASTSSSAPAVSYASPAAQASAAGIAVGALIQTFGQPGSAFVRFGESPGYARCSGRVALPATSGRVRVTVRLSGLLPHTSYHFQLVASSSAGTTYGSKETFTAPSSGTIAPGVEVGTIELGGDSRSAALARLREFLAAPLRFSFEGAYWSAPRSRLGAGIGLDALVAAALRATPGSHLKLPLTLDRTRLTAYLATVNTRFAHAAQNASVRLVGTHAVVEPARPSLSVDMPKMESAIGGALDAGASELLRLQVTTKPGAHLPPAKAVVVRLGSQTLTAYLNGKPVVTTPVTTGRPALPTPVGSYHIYLRASPYVFISPWPPGSPYWYPPTPVNWAEEFYDGDFLHNDPGEPSDAFGAGSEDGAYASHGCVHVPYSVMQFLWNWLPLGSQVVVSQS